MEVIGAGFGRTGTKSLQSALEVLGYGKCYHMVSLFGKPEDIKYWEDAASGKNVDWDSLFKGHQSVVDFPGSIYYKELLIKYPDAKIILTVREPESWYKSTMSTIYSFSPDIFTKLKLLFTAPFISKSRNLFRVVKYIHAEIWGKLFEGQFENKSKAIEIFQKNTKDVIDHVPADKLLVFDVKEGWEPLCKFLNKPVPNIPFPKLNTKDTFHGMTKDFLSHS